MLLFFGGLAFAGPLLGVMGAIAAGDTEELLGARVLTVMTGFIGLGVGLVALARQLSRRVPWARTVSLLALLGIAGLVVVSTVLMIQDQEGDGGAYVLMGGVMIAFLCFVGVVDLLRSSR